jgi:hypothetical protein
MQQLADKHATTLMSSLFGSQSKISTVHRIVSSPLNTYTLSSANVVLNWPTNAVGFALQSTANLSTEVWSTVSPAPVVVSGQYTVTNPISGHAMFYRLSQ